MFAWLGFVIVCYLLADLLAGFWHWAEDRYFDESWLIIGKHIAKPNMIHHEQPTAFLQQGYWSRNWTTLLPAAVGFAMVCQSPWCLVFVFVSQANEIHAWAHQRCSSWVRVLQEIGLLQSPRHHGLHHRVPFDCKYCVMSDWLNPVLDGIGFWKGLEQAIYLVLRLKTKG